MTTAILVVLLLLAAIAFVNSAVEAIGPLRTQAIGLSLLTVVGIWAVVQRPRSGEVPVTFTFTGTGTATVPPGLPPSTTTTTTVPVTPPSVTDFGGFRPHFQGFGATTRGGRGGPVCTVNTLTISGTPTFGTTGDLADCVAPRPGCANTWQTCARQVVFGVSGTSTGTGQIAITSPFLTVAGATAPQGGFTLVDARFLIDTHEVYIGHLRIRRPPASLNALSVGDAGDGGDNAHVRNVILDHVTVSWATGVNNYLQAGPGSSSVLLTDALIYEGLWPDKLGGIGAGVGGDVTVVRTVIANHWSRQPIWGSGTRIILANNVIYNGTDNTPAADTLPAFFGDADGDGNAAALTEAMILWNVLIPGPNSGNPKAILGFSKKPGSMSAGSKAFLEGNVGPGITAPSGDGQWVATVCGNYGTQYQNAATCGPSSNVRTNTPFAWWLSGNMATLTGAGVRDTVLASAGARPKERDSADARIVQQVRDGTGTHYLDWNTIQSQYGGLPTIASVTRAVPMPTNPNTPGACGTYSDKSARTVFDCFLESDPAFGARRVEIP